MNLNIIKNNGKASIWPGNAVSVTCLGTDLKEYEATIHLHEFNLIMHLKTFARDLETKEDMKNFSILNDLIEAYGQECYDKGSSDEQQSNAGPEL